MADRDNALNRFKLVFLGDQSVGKTAIITRFIYDGFNNTYEATVGIDFLTKTMYLEGPSYIRDSDVAIVVYDITNAHSFEQTSQLIEDVRTERGHEGIIFLVGNKTDLVSKRQVSMEQGQQKANELNVMFIETSAKTGYNVNRLFRYVTEVLPVVYEGDQDAQNVTVRLQATGLVGDDDHRVVPDHGGCAC